MTINIIYILIFSFLKYLSTKSVSKGIDEKNRNKKDILEKNIIIKRY